VRKGKSNETKGSLRKEQRTKMTRRQRPVKPVDRGDTQGPKMNKKGPRRFPGNRNRKTNSKKNTNGGDAKQTGEAAWPLGNLQKLIEEKSRKVQGWPDEKSYVKKGGKSEE